MMSFTDSQILGDPDVSEIILGQSPPSSSYNKEGDGLPFYQGKVDFGLVSPTPRVWCRNGNKVARKWDVLLSVRAPVGDVNLANEDCVIGRGIAAIRAGRSTDPWFLFFAMQFVRPIFSQYATGSTFASINKATLLSLQIPFFSPMEQKGIARQLRHILLCVDHEDSVLRSSKQLKTEVLRELFTRGLRGEPQKETEIGLVPESWDIQPVGKVFSITQGLSLKGNLSEGAEGVPFLRTSNVYWGRIDLTSISRMHANPAIIGDRWLRAGDLLVCEGGEIGRAGLWHGEKNSYTYQNHLHRLRPLHLNVIESRFAMTWFEVGFCLRKVYEGAGNKTTIPNLSRARLAGLPLPIPDIEEQQDIVSILDAIDRKIDLHRRKRALLEELFKSLLHKLMTGEIRVADLDLSTLPGAAITRA